MRQNRLLKIRNRLLKIMNETGKKNVPLIAGGREVFMHGEFKGLPAVL